MTRSRTALAALLLLAAPAVAPAANPNVLTVGKQAVLRAAGGMVRVGADPLLAGITPCAGGVAPRLTLSSYPQSTMRVVTHLDVALPCSGWKTVRGGWRYDGAGAGDGVERVVLGPNKLVVTFGGDGYAAPVGPVGYVQIWFTQGDDRYNARFHNFRRNQADLLVTRKPSKPAAEGESAFWTVLHGVDHSAAKQEACLASLARAAKRDRQDGRSRFLTGMMHLYRFGQQVVRYDDAPPGADDELVAALAAFEEAVPLLWDPVTQVGDSRAPGFVAAARWGLGRVRNDAALQAQGLAELEAAVDVNPFFNIFDTIPVAQAVPFDDPQFATVMSRVTPYILDPNTISCVASQPEICGLQGMAPHNIAGSLMLFGDLFAKNGNPDQAALFYSIASANDSPSYAFHDAVQARLLPTATEAATTRAALWRDGDPSNDPTVIGVGAEACRNCHAK